jgi:poly(3-hydroxybutyrate) depolymerase
MHRSRRALCAALLPTVALLASSSRARADGGAPSRVAGPCAQCVSSLPAGLDPRPLLVLLHGDGESAASMFDAWQAGAAARGIAVLALACPIAEGCTARSWWRWNGDPAWLVKQTSTLGELRPIDRDRMWIVGWSGGASYIGMRTQEFERSFAAIVIHGGGVAPASGSCAAPGAPIYFLVGDANPLHYLVEPLRDHYATCGNDVVWTLLRGADHGGERRALTGHREAILDWLSSKRLALPSQDAATIDATTEAGPGVEPPASAMATAPPPALMAPSPPPPTPSCRCSAPGACTAKGPLVWLLSVGAAVALRQRRRGQPLK